MRRKKLGVNGTSLVMLCMLNFDRRSYTLATLLFCIEVEVKITRSIYCTGFRRVCGVMGHTPLSRLSQSGSTTISRRLVYTLVGSDLSMPG